MNRRIFLLFFLLLILGIRTMQSQVITWDETIHLENINSSVFNFGYPSVNMILLGTSYGLYYSNSDGVSWNRSGSFFEAYITNMLTDHNSNILMTTQDEVYVLKKGDSSWNRVATGSVSGVAVNSENHIYLIASKLYKTTDLGDNWIPVNEEISSGRLYFDSQDVLYHTGYHKGIQVSYDGGATFSLLGFEGVSTYPCIKTASGNIFVITAQEKELYRSRDNGDHWEKLTVGNNRLVFTILNTGNDMLILGTDGGVYYSLDDGENWINSGGDIESYYVKHLSLTKEGTLFACVDNKGIFRSENLTTSLASTEEIPKDYVLYQNYPNPFNPSTKIEYFISKPGTVTFNIFSTTGELIKSYTRSYNSGGKYFVHWEGMNTHNKKVASGIYICYLFINNFHSTIKINLLK